jgi:hypothetical protein
MPQYNGWFPRRRDGIIHLGDAWEVQIDLYGAIWGIPPELIARFKSQLAAVGDNSKIAYSPDGENWTAADLASIYFNGIAYGGGMFVAVGNSGLAYSDAE